MQHNVYATIVGLFLFLVSGVLSAATVTASSCSEADVSSAISTAAVNDTVAVPAGSCTWSTLAISKAVHVKGAGIGVTNITLGTGNSLTKPTTGVLRLSDFSFTKNGGGNGSKGFRVDGPWPNHPGTIIIQSNDFNISGTGLFHIATPGGVIITSNDFTGDADDSFIQPKNNLDTYNSWTSASTMGTLDTAGTNNIYVEDNTFYGGANQGIDCDDGSRCVYRYNTNTYSSFNTHGAATSTYGVRHFEVYNNTFIHDGSSADIANQNWVAWIRGGTGVIYNNDSDDIAGGWWGDKDEFRFTIRGAESPLIEGSCGNTSYPVTRQLGQGHNGTSQISEPIYIWGNTGAQAISAGWNYGNPCGFNFSDFFQLNRDYYVNSGAKPGYTAYAYPHPLINADPPAPAPVFTAGPAVSNVTDTAVDVSATVTTETTLVHYYGIWTAASPPADEAAIIAGTGAVVSDLGGTSASGVEVTDTFTGLTLGTQYRLYWVAKDATDNATTQGTYAAFSTTGGTLPALPDGPGLSGSYPNDIGITAHADVLFADGFETYSALSELTSSGNWDSYYQSGNLLLDTTDVYDGAQSMRIRMPQSGVEVSNELGKNIADQDTVHIRSCIKYASNYAGMNSGHNGMRISANYPGPGSPPDGTDFMLVNFEHVSPWEWEAALEAEPGYSRVYVYHPEQDNNYGEHFFPDGRVSNGAQDFGADFVAITNTVPPRGSWVCHELMVQLNTPGIRDGRIAIWENGVLIGDWPNMRFRDIQGLYIDRIQIENGGQGSTQINDKHYDNVVVATSYIGPMSTGAALDRPNPPTNLREAP